MGTPGQGVVWGSVLSVDSVAIVTPVTFSLDHAVIFVEDLNEATADFERVGFQVTPGGTHAGGLTKNALIPLADGTYLELLAFNIPETHRDLSHSEALKTIEGTTPMDHRFLPRGAEGEGFRDLVLGTVGLREVVGNARAAGLEIEGPFPGRRLRPDGTEVAWLLGFPRDPELPFLIEDTTNRDLRVPGGKATRHPNGVVGLSEIVVHVDDFDGAVDRYRRLLLSQADKSEDAAVFHLDNGQITLRRRKHTTLLNQLRLCASSSQPTGEFECHGVGIEIRHDALN